MDKRKNRLVPEIPFVTTLFVFTTTGTGNVLLQMDEVRLVANCRVNPVALVGHSTRTFVPEGMMVNFGGTGGAAVVTIVKYTPLPTIAVVGVPLPVVNATCAKNTNASLVELDGNVLAGIVTDVAVPSKPAGGPS